MLIIVPPSETKAPSSDRGKPVDLEALSFPELTATRQRIIEALVDTSRLPDAFERLRARPSHLHDIAMNAHVLDLPARPVFEGYTGPLHEGLDAAGLSPAGKERGVRGLVVVSALWGALRPMDRIPRYRLVPHAELAGIGRPDHAWRKVLPGVLEATAGERGVIVDLRAPPFQALGMPAGPADRTVIVRIDQGPRHARIGEVITKRARGQVAHHLLESDAGPQDLHHLADIIGERWPLRLEAPSRSGRAWTLTISLER